MNNFFVPGPLPNLNDMLAARGSNFQGNKGNSFARMKKEWESLIVEIILAAKIKRRDRVWVAFEWREKDRRRDPDNIAAAKKFILDAMVTAGVIENDGWKQISGWSDRFSIDKKHPGVAVEVLDAVR